MSIMNNPENRITNIPGSPAVGFTEMSIILAVEVG
jgi:hypothetical protein